MTTRIDAARRRLRAAATDPDLPWMLAFTAALLVTGSTAVLAAFWAALAARLFAGWLTRHDGPTLSHALADPLLELDATRARGDELADRVTELEVENHDLRTHPTRAAGRMGQQACAQPAPTPPPAYDAARHGPPAPLFP